MEDYEKIQAMVQKDATDIANSTYKKLGTQYGVPEVPIHIHNGTDSPKINYSNLTNTPTIPAAYTVPSGMIFLYGANSAPTGYFICDGSAVSRTTYAALFAVLSTTWGIGDGSTTFNIPDMRGYAPVGYKSGDTGTPNFGTYATSVGEKYHLLVTGEIPAHSHSTTADVYSVPGIGGNAASGSQVKFDVGAVGNTGGDGTHNNIQPSVVLTFIIKT